MNDFVDRYEIELLRAHAREYAPPRARRLRFPVRRAAVVAAALLAAASATAATTDWDPFASQDRYLPAPTTTHAPPARSLTKLLAVLRRPQRESDRSEQVRHALDAFDTDVQGVQLSHVRLLPHGAVLVPVERLVPRGDDDTACLYAPSGDGTGGLSCFTAATITAGHAVLSQGDVMHGLVPDGVATVRLIARDRSMVVGVSDNYFRAHFPAALIDPNFPVALADVGLWYDVRGRLIRTVFPRGKPSSQRRSGTAGSRSAPRSKRPLSLPPLSSGGG